MDRARTTMCSPLAWGQQWSWREQQRSVNQRPPSLVLSGLLDLPDRGDAELVRRAVQMTVSRHAGLRSTFQAEDGSGPQQVVWPADERRYEYGELDGTGVAEWSRRGFELGSQWPIRVALVHDGSRARQLAVAVHHIATDGYGFALLTRELRAALAEPALGGTPSGRPVTWQPGDIAAYEQSSEGVAVDQRAIAYWRGHEDHLVDFLSALSTGVTQRSDAMHVTRVQCMAADTRMAGPTRARRGSGAAVAVAAVGCVLARFAGRAHASLTMRVANRHLLGYQDSVCSVAENGVVSFPVRDPRTLADVVPHAWQATVAAVQHGYYDPSHLRRSLNLAGAQGGPMVVSLPCVNFSELQSFVPEYGPPPSPEDLRGRQFTTWSGEVPRPCAGLNFHVRIVGPCLLVELRAGTHLVSADVCRTLATDVMRLLLGQRVDG